MEQQKKCHAWSDGDDDLLRTAIVDCEPIFEHYRTQNKSYNEANAWDAVAGRLLPVICVTGAACRRRWDIIKKKENSTWDKTIELVNTYERELAETTFDGVSEMLGEIDALHDRLTAIENKLDTSVNISFELRDMWK